MNPYPLEIPVSPSDQASSAWIAWVVGGTFTFLAAWFIVSGTRADVPLAPAVRVAHDRVAPGPRREPMGEPALVMSGGFSHRCMDCHRIFESPAVQREKRVQHTHIRLLHGMNDNCFNCHSRTDRNSLALTSGQLITFDEVPRQCAQCHGTVFRDWQRGTHGKTLGSWDASSGNQTRLTCNQCHDPHAPAYPGIEPLPAPVTLRMGDQPAEVEHGHARHAPIRDGAARARGNHSDSEHGATPEPHPSHEEGRK
jgi:hypothetical protein